MSLSSQADTSIVKPQSTSLLKSLINHPIGFWFIFWGEFAERCSYYGMRAILASYMIDKLGMSTQSSGTYNSIFIGSCYLLPLAGGFIADKYIGKYKAIVFFSVPYVLGHVILGFENYYCLIIALALLAMGSGVTKPNISALMGLTYDQKRPGDEELRTTAFSLFYTAVNIGAALSQIGIPWVRTHYGYQMAFLFPAALMVVALVIFAAGKRFYAHEVLSRVEKTPEERKLQWQVLGQIGSLFLLAAFFWAIFDQSSSTWIFFGRMYQDTTLFGGHVDVEQVQATNAILIVVLTPLFAVMWAFLRTKGLPVAATTKLLIGFVLTGLCMAIMAVAGFRAGPIETLGVPLGPVESQQAASDKLKEELPKAMPRIYAAMLGSLANPMTTVPAIVTDVNTPAEATKLFVRPENKCTIWWQVLAYFIITVAEILISITGLELAFVAAPQSMKSFVTSLWLLTVFLGNFALNIPLAQIYPVMNPGQYFALLAGMMLVVAAVFFFVARRFNRNAASQ